MTRSLRILLCVALVGLCSSSITASTTDSLWTRYQDARLSVRERLTALHDVIHELRSNDVDSSRILAERMRVEALVAKDTLMTALAATTRRGFHRRS